MLGEEVGVSSPEVVRSRADPARMAVPGRTQSALLWVGWGTRQAMKNARPVALSGLLSGL